MRSMLRTGLVLACVATAGVAWAQPGEGRGFGPGGTVGGGRLFLLGQKSVQTELKLSPEQSKELEERSAEMRSALSGLREKSREERQKIFEEQMTTWEAALQKTLAKEQLQRLKEISWQQSGGRALRDKEVATALALSEPQTKQVDEILAAARAEMRGSGGLGGQDPEELRARFEARRKATEEKLLAVLNADQQAQWKELQGVPFTGEIVRRRGGFGGAGQ